jgi:hypothetical protein
VLGVAVNASVSHTSTSKNIRVSQILSNDLNRFPKELFLISDF